MEEPRGAGAGADARDLQSLGMRPLLVESRLPKSYRKRHTITAPRGTNALDCVCYFLYRAHDRRRPKPRENAVDPDAVERRLVAVLAADVVGYSRLVEADEAGTLAAIRKLRSEAIEPLLSRYHGRIVKLMGDGVIAEFGSVVDAVTCAVAVQKESAASQADIPAEGRIVLRIGVNLGDVVVDGDDLLGDGVNVAARLEQLCPPGGVLVSGTAYDQLQGKLDLPIDDAGEQQVKNITRPVRTYSVRMDGMKRGWRLPTSRIKKLLPLSAAMLLMVLLAGVGLWWFRPAATVLSVKPSIAVLPFANIGGNDATGRLANGVTEDIITDLARYRDVDVIARNSTAIYEGKPVDIRQVGRDLNVRYVLEGSVQRQNELIRITAQLLDARTAVHLWSERWDRQVGDLFAVQTEISDQVTSRLSSSKGAIPEAERVAGRRTRPQDLTAYELYLLAREALQRFTKDSIDEAIRLLMQAVDKDPKLARAWVELAAAHSASKGFGAKYENAQRSALDAAQHALQLDPMDALGHATLGFILGDMDDFHRAEAEFETALRLNPGSADIMTLYAGWASTFGQPERGAEFANRAIRLNPNYPVWAGNPFRHAYFMAGRYEDSLRILERQPIENYTIYAWVLRAATNAALGRRDEAKAWLARALERYPDLTIQGFNSQPGWSDAERKRLIETMREAGFPLCARPGDLSGIANPARLPECVKN
jgi:TolB-like protein/class 3 adenylate cyclase